MTQKSGSPASCCWVTEFVCAIFKDTTLSSRRCCDVQVWEEELGLSEFCQFQGVILIKYSAPYSQPGSKAEEENVLLFSFCIINTLSQEVPQSVDAALQQSPAKSHKPRPVIHYCSLSSTNTEAPVIGVFSELCAGYVGADQYRCSAVTWICAEISGTYFPLFCSVYFVWLESQNTILFIPRILYFSPNIAPTLATLSH